MQKHNKATHKISQHLCTARYIFEPITIIYSLLDPSLHNSLHLLHYPYRNDVYSQEILVYVIEKATLHKAVNTFACDYHMIMHGPSHVRAKPFKQFKSVN